MSGFSHVTNPVEPAGDQLLGIDAAKPSSGDDDRDYWERLINEEVAARFLGFSVRALQGWRYRGGGPRYCRVSSRGVRYRRKDLAAWADQHIRTSTSDPGKVTP